MRSQKRIAFVSTEKTHELASYIGQTDLLVGKFFLSDLVEVESIEQNLADFQPDLVIVFRPELFSGNEHIFEKYFSVGYFIDQLPFDGFFEDPGLVQNFENLKTCSVDLRNAHNLFIARNSNSSKAFELLFDIWQYRVLPVNDSVFQAGFEPMLSSQNHALFYGEINSHDASFIDPMNRINPVITNLPVGSDQIANNQFSIGINLHCSRYRDFEQEAVIHMANGRLLLTQPLSPVLNFKHGFSHLEFVGPDHLANLLEDVACYPASYQSIRRYGFHAAYRHRASKVWSEIVRDIELCR